MYCIVVWSEAFNAWMFYSATIYTDRDTAFEAMAKSFLSEKLKVMELAEPHATNNDVGPKFLTHAEVMCAYGLGDGDVIKGIKYAIGSHLPGPG